MEHETISAVAGGMVGPIPGRVSYDACFPRLNEWYPLLVPGGRGCVGEPGERSRNFPFSERHVQAVWYDPRWRPVRLVTVFGETVQVEFPGQWNREAGPDFLGAVLKVGPDERRLCGDVEVHVAPMDWVRHGHLADPRYRRVCLHVTYFEEQLPDEALPPGALQLSLRPLLKADPSFAFEHVDVTAYPFAGRADLPPCRNAWAGGGIEAKAAFLEAAGRERLRAKAVRFASALTDQGLDQVFYQAFLSALGYQHNRRPYHELAARIPLDHLLALAKGDETRAYALLAGVSGLLPASMEAAWDEETRSFIRHLWDHWWKVRTQAPTPMPSASWRLNGVRPLNHPFRRMAAAARMFARPFRASDLLADLLAVPPGRMAAALAQRVEMPGSGYWSGRDALGAAPRPCCMALVGPIRMEVIVLNVILPLAAAAGHDPDAIFQHLQATRPEPHSQPMRQTAFYLFGPDAPSALFATPLRRQGLLQVFHDFCLTDRSMCARCPLPAHIEANLRRATSTMSAEGGSACDGQPSSSTSGRGTASNRGA